MVTRRVLDLEYIADTDVDLAAVAAPNAGEHAYVLQTGQEYVRSGSAWVPLLTGGVSAHGLLTGLTAPADDHTQYALLAGRSGGQTLHGGTGTTDTLTLRGTAHATQANSAILLVPDGGRVAIGSPSPYLAYGLLEIYPDGTANGGITMIGTTITSLRMYITAGTDVFHFTRGGDDTKGLSVTADGYVGIGTATPMYGRLEVWSDGTENGGLTVQNATLASFRMYQKSIGGTDTLLLSRGGVDTLGFSILYPSGAVGIGTTSPAARLAINGGCHVGGDSDPGDDNLTVDGHGRIDGTLAVGGMTPDSGLSIHYHATTTKGQLRGTVIADSNAPQFQLCRARSGPGAMTASDQSLGLIVARGYDGTDYRDATWIRFATGATPGSGDMPGKIEFYTTPDGSTTPGLAATIHQHKGLQLAGNLGIRNAPHTVGAAGNEYTIYADTSFTDSTADAAKRIVSAVLTYTPSAANRVFLQALALTAQMPNTAAYSIGAGGYLVACSVTAFNRSNYDIPTIYGLDIGAGLYNGASDSTGSCTTCYGIRIQNQKTASGTITNHYGIHISNILGTNPWDVYAATSTAKNYFAGLVTIGTTGGAAKLSIDGGCHVGGTTDPGDDNLLVDGTARIGTGAALGAGALLDLHTSTASVAIAHQTETNFATSGSTLLFRRGRASGATVLSGDTLWTATVYGRGSDSTWLEAARIEAAATANFSSDYAAPARLSLYTGAADGTAQERLRVQADGTLVLYAPGSDSAVALQSYRHTATAAIGAALGGYRSRGSAGSPSVVASGDRLLQIGAYAYDGSAYLLAGSLEWTVDGTPGTNDMPSRFSLSLTADGAASTTERLRVTQAGGVILPSGTVPTPTNIEFLMPESRPVAWYDSGGVKRQRIIGVTTSSIADGGTYDVTPDGLTQPDGFILVECYDGTCMMGLLPGGSTSTAIFWQDASNTWTTTKDSAGKHNYYWDSSASRFRIQNKTGTARAYSIFYFTTV